MKAKVTDQKGCKRFIGVEIPKEEVEDKFKEVFAEISKVAEIPGFRKGKAPRDIIEKKYGAKAAEEVLKDLVASSYEEAIKQLKIIPVEYPKVSDAKLDRNKPLTYKAEVDVRPDIKLNKYKGLKVNKNETKVEDADVEKATSNLQELHAKFTAADERSVSDGDYIVCDLACRSGEKEIFKKESMWLLVNKEGTIKELHESILGMKKDEEKEIRAELPQDYPNKELAGKEASYKIKIKHVKEKKLPALDDEFAKDLGKSSVQELKEAVKKDLIKRAEIAINENMRSQILEQLLKNSSLEVPEAMADRQLEGLINDAKDRMLSQGVQEKEINANIDTVREKMKPRAINQVKLFFLLDEIARLENIKVDPQEVDRALEVMAGQMKKDKKKLLEEYEKTNILQQVIGQVREEKIMEFLLKEAEVVKK